MVSKKEKSRSAEQMKLNCKKTKNIIFNFSRNNQFSTDLKIDGEVVETVRETKLLGTHITDKQTKQKHSIHS